MRKPQLRMLAMYLLVGLLVLGSSAVRAEDKPSLISPFKTMSGAGDATGQEIVILEFSDAGTTEVLKALSDISGWTIIPSEKIKGKISFFAKDTSCRTLLNALVQAHDWVTVEKEGIIIVMTREEYDEQYGPTRKVYHLKHADAKDLEAPVKTVLSKRGKVTAEPMGNCLIVVDTKNNIEKIDRIIAELDEKQVTRVFQIGFGPSQEMRSAIKTILSKDGKVAADKPSGRIVVRDSAARVQDVATVIAQFHKGVITEVFQLKHAAAKDVSREIKPMVAVPTNISFDERSNQIVVTDSESNLRRIQKTLERLDREDIYFTRTFHLEHADCLDVAKILREALGRTKNAEPAGRVVAEAETPKLVTTETSGAKSGTKSEAPAPVVKTTQTTTQPVASVSEESGLSAGPTITPDSRINAVIVTDTPAMLARIERLIKELDAEEKIYAYELKYADPEKLKLEQKLKGLLTEKREHFAVDEISRTVTFTTSAGKAKQVLALLKEWDKRPRQIYIEAKVFSIDREDGCEIGTEFEGLLHQLSSKITPETVARMSFPGNVADSPGSLIQVGSLAADSYRALIRMIETHTKTKLLSSPKIVALDGNPALFQVATDEPFKEVTTDTEGNRIVENVKFIPVGVTLKVLPNINDDDVVSLDVSLEVSSLKEVRDGVPVVKKSFVQSRVVIEKDHTLIIGGLISERTVDVKSGVPFLQRIPLLGWLFRSTKKEKVTSELVLLLTPHIASASSEDVLSKDLDKKWEDG